MTQRAKSLGLPRSPWLVPLAVLAACSATPHSTPEQGPGAAGSGGAPASGGAGSGAGPGAGANAGAGGVTRGAAGTASGAGGSAAPAQDGGEPAQAGAGGRDANPGETDAGAERGGAGASGSGADPSCEGDSEVDFALVGWATEGGGTTGGQGGTTIEVSTGAALVQALLDKQDSDTPLTILVSGVLTEANSGGANKFDVKEVRDVSILGKGSGAELDGIGIKIVRAGNIVIRNLKVHNVLIGDKDAISIEGPVDHVWIDHCELYAEYQGVDKDYYDGLLDAKTETEYLTYSWNYLHDSWKTALVGSSEDDTFDRKLTIHHNHFGNCNSRLPLFRGGNGHVFDNFYEDVVDTGINARLGACLRIEGNYFDNAHNPWVSAYSDTLGGGELSCNVLANGSAFEYASDVMELPTCVAEVPYEYASVLNHPDEVAAIVEANAGVGKLADPTQF